MGTVPVEDNVNLNTVWSFLRCINNQTKTKLNFFAFRKNIFNFILILQMTRKRNLSDGKIAEMLQEEDNSETNDDEIDVDDSVEDPSYSPNEDSYDDDEFGIGSNLERMLLEEEENSAASDDEENDEPSQVQWSDYKNRTQSFLYIEQGGLNVTLLNDINPQQIYERLVDQDVISLIV